MYDRLGSTRLRMLAVSSFCVVTFCSSHVVAQTTGDKRRKFAQNDTLSISAPVRIAIETSRSQPSAGSGLGVNATIINAGKQPITLNSNGINLTLPPELATTRTESLSWQAFIPGGDEIPDSGDPPDTRITLQPGGSVRVAWEVTRGLVPPEEKSALRSFLSKIYFQFFSEMHFLFFVPGDYDVTVDLKYWIGTDFSDKNYGTTVQTATIHVVTPQFVLLFGAALGGLIAYFIQSRRRSWHQEVTISGRYAELGRTLVRFIRSLVAALATMLLSAIITILLSRISESQFLIRITISDFWGAIAVGFIAAYSGGELLTRLIGTSVTKKTSVKKTTTGAQEALEMQEVHQRGEQAEVLPIEPDSTAKASDPTP